MLPKYFWPKTYSYFVILLIKLLPAPLLLLSLTLKLTIVTLFYSIYLLDKSIIFNLSWRVLLLAAVTKTPKFHHTTPTLKSLHWLEISARIKYKVLSLTYKSLKNVKTGPACYLCAVLSLPSHCCTRSSSLITFSCPSHTIVLNYKVWQNPLHNNNNNCPTDHCERRPVRRFRVPA